MLGTGRVGVRDDVCTCTATVCTATGRSCSALAAEFLQKRKQAQRQDAVTKPMQVSCGVGGGGGVLDGRMGLAKGGM